MTAFQPKLFYRDLDSLLGEVEADGRYAESFPRIVQEFVERFGASLSIETGRLFVEDEGEFVSQGRPAQAIAYDETVVANILQHGVFLFDTSQDLPDASTDLGRGDTAALFIEGDPRRIFTFTLRPEWARDDLDFALNTLRNAIQDRIGFQDMKVDLEQAAEIQRSLLPERAPELPGYTIASRSIPAATVGGDFFDYVPFDEETVVLAIGDASGHGLAAALLARDVVTGIRMGAERSLKITEILHRLNRVIARSALSSRFVSMIFAELEANGNVFYVNAGHPAGRLFGARGERRLERGGMILGPIATATFQRGFAHVDRGDTLVFVTDGVLERINDAGEMFGEEGVARVVEPRAGQPAEEILDALFEATRRWGGDRPWMDDTTGMVITRSL